MALRASFRTIAPLARPAAVRSFHATPRAFVKVGDEIPDLEVLHESTPGTKINLAEEFKDGDGYIVGVPAAFSGTCSSSHVPSYINHPKLKEAGKVFVVSVNDVFVMKAWGEQLDPSQQSGIRFLGDPSGAFTKALDLGFDGAAIFGGTRSKRYALKVENGRVAAAHVEPDGTGYKVSMAEKVIE